MNIILVFRKVLTTKIKRITLSKAIIMNLYCIRVLRDMRQSRSSCFVFYVSIEHKGF